MKNVAWTEISRDPNAPAVLSFRKSLLTRARCRDLITDRINYLVSQCKGKYVLDVGVVEHFAAASSEGTWLHSHISVAASACLGIDILSDEVSLLRGQGYCVEVHDITKGPLQRKFDVIVVGDVVEHLNEPAALFVNSRQMLALSGRLILTTPNPWYANVVLKNIFNGLPFTDSADHVAWFDPSTMCELGSRAGLRLDKYCGVREKGQSLISRIFFAAAPVCVLLGIRPEIFAKTMIYEFVVSEMSDAG